MVTTVRSNLLLPSLQRDVAQRVLAAGLSRQEFAFQKYGGRDNSVVTALCYQPSPEYLFVFYPGAPWEVAYSPSDLIQWDERTLGDWPAVLSAVDVWLRCLKRELEIGNPWSAFLESSEPFDFGMDGENSSFGTDERESIIAQLQTVRRYLLENGQRSDDDRAAIKAGFDRMESSLDRTGRLDWRSLSIGILVELALLGYATPEGVRYAVNFLFGAAGHLLR